MSRKKMICSEEAVVVKKQHTSPCSDCPWRRDSVPGWLGAHTAGEWVAMAHGETRIECHTRKYASGGGPECAGAAIYRANVHKSPRFPTLRLPQNVNKVFAWFTEFLKHHGG
jgi:hypothetical protein